MEASSPDSRRRLWRAELTWGLKAVAASDPFAQQHDIQDGGTIPVLEV